MTFNLKFAENTPPNAWSARRPVVRELVRNARPDVMGTQEGLPDQLRDLAQDLAPDYEWIGEGREGGGAGEYVAVLFRTDRLRAVESGNYWLSETPERPGSRSRGANLPRMVTWVRFEDRAAGRDFYLINTHFDHESGNARVSSAELILNRCARFAASMPIVLTGDFNDVPGSPAFEVLRAGGFTDTWGSASRRGREYATFHGYRGAVAGGPRIDWILTRGSVLAESVEIRTYAHMPDGNRQFPSDHFPVQACLRLQRDATPAGEERNSSSR